MTKVFENRDFGFFKKAIEKKKAVLILCKTDKTSLGFLIVDPIVFDSWNT